MMRGTGEQRMKDINHTKDEYREEKNNQPKTFLKMEWMSGTG